MSIFGYSQVPQTQVLCAVLVLSSTVCVCLHWLSYCIHIAQCIFSTAHHRWRIIITEQTNKRRRLIQRYVRKGNYSNKCSHFIHKCAALWNA